LTIDKLNSPLNDGNGILTCRWHVAEPTAAMADDVQARISAKDARHTEYPMAEVGADI
jgi:hypothetical protein